MRILSVRQEPEYKDIAIKYLQQSWPEVSPIMYEDCISNCIGAEQFLPQWYLLEKDNEIIGCAGLITNDFISRGDLYPWICALYIDEEHRGNNYAALLLEKANRIRKLADSNT
ncbi:GNAT family N-acetyltransferase [Flavobacterium lindanitolerans]|jgi:GNAT superfamily N-acetyltransferase|uniref:GNAT family N-acetyltransferase n=1 Tax=Flavobacterium lindanitolerans TaxID=428988 RepID=UPI0023F3A82F|nr:GNAT family N-acetyltransferase [Flavobacterium lindanitolerans]